VFKIKKEINTYCFYQTNNMRYLVETPVNYANSAEYRRCIRLLFEMDQTVYEKQIDDIEAHNQEVLDAETRDEMCYDGVAAINVMDYVYDCTKDTPEFALLYTKAAARMFSEDPNLGIAILFSYDYLQLFHACLVEFYSDRFNPDSPPYRELLKQIS